MKNIKYYALLIIILGSMSCKKSFFDINTSPNQPQSVTIDLVLPSALETTGSVVSDGNEFANYWLGFWAVSGGYAPNITEVTYKFSNTYHQNIWSNLYYAINNFNYIEQTATTQKSYFFEGVAKVMKAYCYQNLIDLYGNVPYSQALQISRYPTPAYDTAQNIYGSLLAQIDSAKYLIANYQALSANQAIPAPAPAATSDIMFQGNQTLWLKFANTLKLRLLMRLSQMQTKPNYFQPELDSFKTDQIGFLGVGQSALENPGYSNASDAKENPFYYDYGFNAAGNVQGNYGYYRANSYAINFFQNTNDPRIQFFYAPYSGSSYAGNDFGVQGLSNSVISGIGQTSGNQIGIINTPSQSAPILTSFESLFLQAEAAQRGWIKGDYKALYKKAIDESFQYCGIDSTTSSAYYGQTGSQALQNQVNIDLTNDPITTIITQKWAAVNVINPLETYAEYRRLHIPANAPGSKAGGLGPIPYRLYYPFTEVSTNPTNVAAQGNITIYTKIFWMP